jgi:hypothetical protein
MRAGHAVRRAISGLLATIVATFAAMAALPGQNKAPVVSTLRWQEGQTGCTFSRDDDGKYRYGLWTPDFGIVVAVDSQELEKIRRRAQPIFTLQLTVHNRSKDLLDVVPDKINLEFVKHYHDVHNSLDPDELARQQRSDADKVVEEAKREIHKHPEKKEEKEAASAARQKDAAEMIDFLNTRSLRAVQLDTGRSEVTGWVLFDTRSKWIRDLQKQEEFVLRVPLGGKVVEFPFLLPPSEGDLILRRRPEN